MHVLNEQTSDKQKKQEKVIYKIILNQLIQETNTTKANCFIKKI